MKRLAAPLLVLLLALAPRTAAGAQEGASRAAPGAVRGVAADAAGQPVAGAAVAVRRAGDTVVVARAAADAGGRFRVEGLPTGRLAVRVSHPGFAPRTVEVELGASAPVRDLGTVRLEAAPLALEGLEVRAERSPVVAAPDRTVYGVRDMPVASGGSAVDVLRNVPELEVDLEGRVSLRGSAGVTIHLNGRPTPVRGDGLAAFLQQFPASRIERIEVIPNPSAKFDPEGSAGIVNIVLKDDADLGLSGTLALNGGTRGNGGGSARLAYQEGPLTLFGGGSLNLSRRRGTSYNLRENRAAQPVTWLEQDSRTLNRGAFGMVDLSAELRVGKRTTLHSSVSGYRNGSDSEGSTAYSILDAARAPLERYLRDTEAEWSHGTVDASLGLRFAPKPQRHELSLELRRSGGGSGNDARWLRETLTAAGDPAGLPPELTLSDSDEGTRALTLQADYTRPLGAGGKLETGYRGSLRTNDDDDRVRVSVPADPALPSRATEGGYTYREDTHSVYATLGGRSGKLGFQGGLRAEHAAIGFESRPTDQGFDDRYVSLFPSASLSYDLGRGRQSRLTYSRRIERPWPFFLNPSVPSADPLNRTVGNPGLRPKYTHSVSADLSWTASRGTLRLAPYYRLTTDNWEQIRRVDEAGVSTMTWENLASIESYGTTLTASLRPAGRVSGFASMSGYRELRDAGSLVSEFSGAALRWSASANTTVRVAPSLSVQGMARYNPPRDLPQGRYSSTLMTSVGARQELWGKKAWINLSVMDPFDLWRFEFQTRDRTHAQVSRSSWGMRMATASFTYSFGRPPQQAPRRTVESPAPQQQEPVMQ